MTNEEKLQKIARHYGYESQSRQCTEEMAELTIAINKLWRLQEYDSSSKEIAQAHMNILEELADVQIMISQLAFLLGMEDCEVLEMIDWKLDRQIERIEHET